MLWTEIAIQTLREPVHPLLMRAGYKHGAEYLALGRRSLAKIEKIFATETDFGRALALCGIEFIHAGRHFVAKTSAGNCVLVLGQDYAALEDEAVSIPVAPVMPDPDSERSPEEFATPGVKTIAQISEFSGLPSTSQIKSLVMRAGDELVLMLLRGDHQMSERKLLGFLKIDNVRPALPEQLRAAFGADAGSLGPVGVGSIRILVDDALRGRRNMICGANRNDFHLRNVTPEKDFACAFANLRRANEGDECVNGGPLEFVPARRLDTPESILETAAEQHRDNDGLALPASIAPFDVILTPVHPSHLEVARGLAGQLTEAGLHVLLDDRDARAGVKFKDADLIGVPWRVNLGKKLAEGLVEVVERKTKRMQEVPLENAAAILRAESASY